MGPLGPMSNDVGLDWLQCRREHLLSRILITDKTMGVGSAKCVCQDASAAVGVPVPPVVPSTCTSRGRLANWTNFAQKVEKDAICAGLRGGQPSSGVRLGDMGVGDLGDFGFIDTLKNALENLGNRARNRTHFQSTSRSLR